MYKKKYFVKFLGNIDDLLDINAILPLIWYRNQEFRAITI